MNRERFDSWQVYSSAGHRKYINRTERDAFLKAASHLEENESALCEVVVHTGCRISEALSLRRYHLDTELNRLVIPTLKRRRIVLRQVPIPTDLISKLYRLPVDEQGRFWTIHRATAWRMIKRIMDAAEVQGPMATCKGLRHGFGMQAAMSGIPINLIQRWLGHASPATTAIYLDAAVPEEREFAQRMWGSKLSTDAS